MVRDNVTGLIWEVKQAKDDVSDYSNPHDADNTYTWYDSNPETNGGDAGTPGDGTDTEDFINAVNSEKFGGYSDWRLPTIKELASITDLGQYAPSIDTKYFPNSVSSYYWSSTTSAGGGDYAWGVSFGGGGDSSGSKSYSRYVRAVRGGQTGSFGPLVINGDDTVTDTGTGLTWQRQAPNTQMNWKEALGYCENLYFAGYSDWRLPSREELRSIVNYEKYDPAADTEYFPEISLFFYCWSSTTSANSEGLAWNVNFSNGDDGYDDKSSSRYVRAVRGGQSGSFDYLVIASIASPSSNMTIYEGESVNFQGSVEDGNTPFTYSWDFNSGASDSDREAPGNVTFQTPGVYTVTFSVSDDDDDTDSDSVTITVIKSPNEPDTSFKAIIGGFIPRLDAPRNQSLGINSEAESQSRLKPAIVTNVTVRFSVLWLSAGGFIPRLFQRPSKRQTEMRASNENHIIKLL